MKIVDDYWKFNQAWVDWNNRQLKKFQARGGSKALRILVGLFFLVLGITIISLGIGMLVTLIGIIPGIALLFVGAWISLAGIGIIRYKKQDAEA